MMEAHLIVDAETLRPGHLGPATGNVWLTIGDTAFPVEGWNDFVIVILEAWVSALLRMLRGLSSRELVHFMDGPFAVELAALAAETVQLRAIKNGCDEVAHVDVEAMPLVEDLLVASERALLACRVQDCWSADADKLSANLPELRRELVRLKN